MHGKHGLVLTDHAGRIIAWNPAQERLTGLHNEQVIGKNLWDVQYSVMPAKARRPGLLEKLRERDLEYLATESWPTAWQFRQHHIVRPDGSTVEGNRWR
jgi:PAS domain S-box-containing protein